MFGRALRSDAERLNIEKRIQTALP